MKKLKFFFVGILFLGVYMACDNESSSLKTPDSSTVKGALARTPLYTQPQISAILSGSEVTINCQGSCNCAFDFNMNTGVGSCTCSPCALDLTFSLTRNVQDRETMINSLLNLEVFRTGYVDIQTYARTQYNTTLHGFTGVTFSVTNDTSVVTFAFKDSLGIARTVMYSLRATKSFRVDCTGSCECKEQYNFNTNTASCSCGECSMTVTEIKSLSAN